MKNALILHGTLGAPEGNWFRWLKNELEGQGMQVWLPKLPHAEQPSLNQWLSFVQQECPFAINDKTLIVGHSSGAILALILTQENSTPVGAVVAASVFHDNSLQWEPNSKLFDLDFQWNIIRSQAKKLLFIHSDDDPYVPLEQARFVANKCSGNLILFSGQGHLILSKVRNTKSFRNYLRY